MCKKGVNVEFPSDRIFLEAFRIMPKDDHYLAMNLSDAFVSAFSRSEFALMNSAETNLGFFENPPSETNVPTARALGAVVDGEWALERIFLQDNTNVYSLTRLMHHVLETIVRKGDRGKVIRRELPYILRTTLPHLEKDDDKAPPMTDDQKAFLLYGKAMFFRLGPAWKKPKSEYLISLLSKAVKLSPETKLYSIGLAELRKNPEELDRLKVAQWQRAQATKREEGLYRELRLTPDDGKRVSPFRGMFYRLQYVVWDTLIEELSKEDERAGKLLRSIGCPGCWGRGKNYWNGTTCPTCNGDGDWSPEK